MRRTVIVLLVAALSVSLAGCGTDDFSYAPLDTPALSSVASSSAVSSAAPSSAPVSSEPADLETAVDNAIKDAGVTKNSVEINDDAGTSEEGDKVVLVKVKAKEGLTTNMMKKGIWLDTKTVLEKLQSRKEIGEVTFFWSTAMVDAYGNESDDVVMKINIKKSTLDKINFKNFSLDNLPKIADSYWQHATFDKK